VAHHHAAHGAHLQQPHHRHGDAGDPVLIVSETSLSFLGLGLRPPAISWGVLLQEAQNIQTIAQAPWLLSPGILVVLAVLAFNLVGDGLRDAADPYSH
jgi:peptide/nickel transport system permease protein